MKRRILKLAKRLTALTLAALIFSSDSCAYLAEAVEEHRIAEADDKAGEETPKREVFEYPEPRVYSPENGEEAGAAGEGAAGEEEGAIGAAGEGAAGEAAGGAGAAGEGAAGEAAGGAGAADGDAADKEAGAAKEAGKSTADEEAGAAGEAGENVPGTPKEDAGNSSAENVREREKETEILRQPAAAKEETPAIFLEYERKYGAAVEEGAGYRTYQIGTDLFRTVFADNSTASGDNPGEESAEKAYRMRAASAVSEADEPSADIHVVIPDEPGDGAGIRITDGSLEAELIPEGGDYSRPARVGNAVRYNEVWENTDVQYTVRTNGYKEDIILLAPTESRTYTYRLPKGDFTAYQTGNAIRLYQDDSLLAAMTVTAPQMTDEAGAESTALTLSLVEEENAYVITLTPDEGWLKEPERVYPVTIDPQIELRDTFTIYTVTADGNPNLVTGETEAFCGMNGSYGKSRMYLFFDYGHISSRAVIDQAKLYLYETGCYGSQELACYRMLEKLNHEGGIYGITWANTVNLDREAAGENCTAGPGTGWKAFDITESVTNWEENITPMHGLSIQPLNDTDGAHIFASENYGDTSLRPYLIIDWHYAEKVPVDYPLDDTTITLRGLVEKNLSGKQFFHGVFADGTATPFSVLNYRLMEGDKVSEKNYNGAFLPVLERVYPDSSDFETAFPEGTSRFRGKLSNWQTGVPFTDLDLNVAYHLEAWAVKGEDTGKTVKSDVFLKYQVTQYDTLPKIADHYGIPLGQLMYDNRVQDMLLVKNNTLFIRNPQKNADNPYNPPELTDEQKADIDAQLMGRGLHCEFGFEPVNLNTGNFYLEETDFSIPSDTGNFGIVRTYNSKDALRRSVFGRGWMFAYEESLTREDTESYRYKRYDGSELVFTEDENGILRSPEGYGMTLTPVKTGSGTLSYEDMGETKEEPYDIYEYEIRETDGTVRRFNCYGFLFSVTDEKGN